MASQKREQAPVLQSRLSPARREDKSRSLALLGMTNHESRVTGHGSRLPATAGRQEDAPCTRRRNPRAARLRRTGPTHERGNGERLEDSPRARWIVPYKKKETQEEGARFGKRPLQGGEGGEFGVGDGFLLEEDLEAFAHAFGKDERFELQARADAVGFIHAVVVEVAELVPLP